MHLLLVLGLVLNVCAILHVDKMLMLHQVHCISPSCYASVTEMQS